MNNETYAELLEKAEELGADCSDNWGFLDRHGFISPSRLAEVRSFIKEREDELASETEERNN